MNRTINRLGVELVIELTKSNPEDYQRFKLMLLSHEKKCKEKDKNFTDYGPIGDNDCVHENTHTRCLFFYFICDLMTGRTLCI